MEEFDLLYSKNHSWVLPVPEEEQLQTSKDKAKYEIEKLHGVPYGINYVLLDYAAWDIKKAFELEPLHACLFATQGAEYELEEYAPYLFEYAENTDFSTWLDKKEKEGQKILYVHSDLSLDKLRKHLRRFLRVFTQRKEWLFFRFYDPNVAPVIIPNLTDQQSYYFFSGINYLVYPDCCTRERKVVAPTVEAKIRIDKKEKIIYPVLVFSDEQMTQMSESRQAFIESKVKAKILPKLKKDPDADNTLNLIIGRANEFGVAREEHMLKFASLAIAYPELLKELLDTPIALAKVDTTDIANKLERVEIYLKSKYNA